MPTESLKSDAEILEEERNWTGGIESGKRTLAAYAEQIEATAAEMTAVEATLPDLSDGTITGAQRVLGAKQRLAHLEFKLFGTGEAHKALEEEVARLEKALAEIKPELDRIRGALA